MTTIIWRDGILAADSAVTVYDGSDDDAQPSGRTYMQKLRVVDLDPYWRLAVASRGDSIDGVQIERCLIAELKQAISGGSHGALLDDRYDLWRTVMSKDDLDCPSDEQGAIVAVTDLRVPHKVYAWILEDYRVVRRIRGGEYFAIGSDAAPAYGALQCGADAVKSVWVACKYGAYSGGPVHYVKTSGMMMKVSRIAPWDDPAVLKITNETVPDGIIN